MTLAESAETDASPEAVWEVLQDLDLMPLWNPKCHACRVLSAGGVGLWARLQVTFRWRGREQGSDAEIIEWQPGVRLAIRYRGGVLAGDGTVDEHFELSTRRDRTVVTHRLDLGNSGVPWIVQALMKLVNTLGHTKGKSIAQSLCDLVENP